MIGNKCVYSGYGGGIYNEGVANLDYCVISNNMAGAGSFSNLGFGLPGGGGGGVYNVGTMTLFNSVITSNYAGQGGPGVLSGGRVGAPSGSGGDGGNGGGAWNSGSLDLFFCTVSDNVAGDGGMVTQNWSGGSGGNGGSGSGIYNEGTLTLNTCTICRNLAGEGGNGGNGLAWNNAGNGGNGGGGGAICNRGSASLICCTVVQNGTGMGGNGGDVDDSFFLDDPYYSGALTTIGNGGNGGDGGGLWNIGTNTAVIWNSIIGLNSAHKGGAGGMSEIGTAGTNGTSGVGSDGNGLFLSRGFNLIGRVGGFTNFVAANGDLLGNDAHPLDPKASPLQMNGGNLPTVTLLPGSPAIDAGDDTILGAPVNLTQDQRGSPRWSGAHVDIGATEHDGTLNGGILPPLIVNCQAVGGIGGALQFHFNGATASSYSIWVSTNLTAWSQLGLASEVSRGWFIYQDVSAGTNRHRFYQVRCP